MSTERNGPNSAASFYDEALSAAERLRLPRARQIEGLDEEIALLRPRLLRHASENPDRFETLLRGLRLLVQAVAVKYRLSPKAADDLSKSIAGVLESVGKTLGLGEFRDPG
jgi:hypothetical protein